MPRHGRARLRRLGSWLRFGSADPAARAQRLARRVRWLDRYRRWIALALAGGFSSFAVLVRGELAATEIPLMYAGLLVAAIGVIAWSVIEVALAYITAVWETEGVLLVRSHGLPRAVVRKRDRSRPPENTKTPSVP